MEQDDNGQVLLIVVLVMVVALTVGLSVISRSAVNLNASAQEIDSQKAFSAAESGIEQVLQTNGQQVFTYQQLGNNATILNASSTSFGNTTSYLMNNGESVHQDDGGDIWLANYDQNPNNINPSSSSVVLTLYWGDSNFNCSNSSDDAALEVIVLSGAKNAPVISHYAYDACSRGNNFSSPPAGGGTINGVALKNHVVLPAITPNPIGSPTGGIFVRVIPLYSDAIIGVSGNVTLPQQGQVITSTGMAGNAQRKVTLYKAYDAVPSELFYTLFSPQ